MKLINKYKKLLSALQKCQTRVFSFTDNKKAVIQTAFYNFNTIRYQCSTNREDYNMHKQQQFLLRLQFQILLLQYPVHEHT